MYCSWLTAGSWGEWESREPERGASVSVPAPTLFWNHASLGLWLFHGLRRGLASQETECSRTLKTACFYGYQFSQFSLSVVSNSLQPHGLQHPRPPCPSPTPRVYSNSCPSSRWWYPTILSSVVPFSSCPQSFTASGSFKMSQFFTSGGQSIGVSASTSVLRINIQDWFS